MGMWKGSWFATRSIVPVNGIFTGLLGVLVGAFVGPYILYPAIVHLLAWLAILFAFWAMRQKIGQGGGSP